MFAVPDLKSKLEKQVTLVRFKQICLPVLLLTQQPAPSYKRHRAAGTFDRTAALYCDTACKRSVVVRLSGQAGREAVREDGGGGAGLQRSQSTLPGWAGRAVHAPGEAQRPQRTEPPNHTHLYIEIWKALIPVVTRISEKNIQMYHSFIRLKPPLMDHGYVLLNKLFLKIIFEKHV